MTKTTTTLKLFLLSIALLSCVATRTASMLDKHKSKDLIDTGVLALEYGLVDKAEASYEMAYAIYASPEALDGLGCVALYKGQLLQAEEYFNLAIAQDERYYRSIGHLAVIYELKGNRAAAEKLFREYLFYEPDNIRMRNNFAVFLSDSNTRAARQQAKQELLRASSIEEHPLVQSNYLLLEKTYE